LPPSIWRVTLSMGTGTTRSRLGEHEAVIYAQCLSPVFGLSAASSGQRILQLAAKITI
jgi:hypothetical protein